MRKRRRVVNHAELGDLDFSRDLLELGVLDAVEHREFF